jgi:hypothetical protein
LIVLSKQGEHLARRQELIGWKKGMNQHSLGSATIAHSKSTPEIAKDVGLTERSAQRRMQVAQRGMVQNEHRVIRAGFEPTTHSLEGCCSIQLSYRTILLLYWLAKITQIQQ